MMLPINKFSEKIENELDFDFHLDTKKIETLGAFEENILAPFEQKEEIFYRGERRSSLSRPLLPSVFRNKEFLFENANRVNLVNNDFLYSFYAKMGEYFDLYERLIGRVETEKMYPFLAFSQHYLGISPLIDFSKNPYSALSFALKDRREYAEDILLYTLEIKNEADYTASLEKANEWIHNYSVLVFRDVTRGELENPLEALADYKIIYEKARGQSFLEMNTPSAKLIDVPTNDLMLYQQGVFLLLDDFSLMGKSYLTRKIRDEFVIKKWLVSKEICPRLLELLMREYPYYAYDCITDLSKIASKIKRNIRL